MACSASSGKKTGGEEPAPASFTLFATTELRGNIEPCGCTSDPMGDLSRTVAMIGQASAGGSAVLYVDAGSMLYQDRQIASHLEAQESMKAELLLDVLTKRLNVAAVGLGPNDLARGPAAVKPPRHAVNLAADAGVPTDPPTVVEVGGAKVGLFGVVSPAALDNTGVSATDPGPAAAKAVAELRANGAQVVVGLAYMTQQEARQVARSAPGIDILVVGQNAPEPDKIAFEPGKVTSGDHTTWLVQPANRGQVVTRLDITVRGDGPLVDAIGENRATHQLATIAERLAKLDAQLAEWANDPNADPEFVAAKKSERSELLARKSQLETSPLQRPDKGPWFVMSQVEIRKRLACDAAVQDKKVALDKAVGDANLKAAANDKPVPPAAGKAGYVGIEECGFCHGDQVEFWKRTKHQKAWETLEKYGKQYSYDCIYCHVSGWKEPGGSTLAVNEHLRDIQCEVCHGPGSLHVDDDGKEKPPSLVRKPEKALCVTCHNELHSDTFEYEAYLRDVTGPGHGEEFRKTLGDGPTGHELRKAAQDKAGAAIGEGCLK